MSEKPNKHYLTAGELIDLLSRYDRDRMVVTDAGTYPFEAVVSVEPTGTILLVTDAEVRCNPINGKIKRIPKQQSFMGGLLGMGQVEDEGDDEEDD